MTDLPADPLALSATALSQALSRRDISARELMAATLARIGRFNPDLNAIVALRDPDALLAEADAADAAPRRGWLHGIPLAVKDLVATAGIVTTWGSSLHAGHLPGRDDLLAARLRAAGAILIGKTNVPEFGLGSHSFNPVYGVTRNPYDRSRSAGGSSGGAAAALAARLVAVADGSDAMGSLRNPAAFCNVYGFRPSWGLVPAEPQGEAFLSTLATDGPMARCPEDLAALLATLAGPDPRVPLAHGSAAAAAGGAAAGGTKIGWLGDWGGAFAVEPEVMDGCTASLAATAAALGWTVEPLAPPFPAERLWQAWTTLRSALIAGARGPLARDPATRAQVKPELLWEIACGEAHSAGGLYSASLVRSEWFRTLAALLARFDALALPAAQVLPFDAALRWPASVAGRTMDSYHRWMEVTVPVSLAGVPCVALPAGFVRGLPVGLQLLAARGRDTALLGLAGAWHAATDWPGRHPPPPG